MSEIQVVHKLERKKCTRSRESALAGQLSPDVTSVLQRTLAATTTLNAWSRHGLRQHNNVTYRASLDMHTFTLASPILEPS
jgi:hypothetical protein